MVKEIKKDGKIYFQCGECEFLYKDKEWAEKCEAFCREHHQCGIEMTAHAVKED